jgi:uncharacterized protein (UPF0548 family)
MPAARAGVSWGVRTRWRELGFPLPRDAGRGKPDRVDDLTYSEHGATRGALPSGYHHLEHRARVGTGRTVFERGAAALMSWEMHRAAGLRVTAEGDARPGERVVSRIAPGIAAPCRVVYVIDEPSRRGFAYGTLPGHPESGEEAFIVEIDEADEVWFTVRAFTRPGTLLARISGPFGRGAQRLMARRYTTAMRHLSVRLDISAMLFVQLECHSSMGDVPP